MAANKIVTLQALRISIFVYWIWYSFVKCWCWASCLVLVEKQAFGNIDSVCAVLCYVLPFHTIACHTIFSMRYVLLCFICSSIRFPSFYTVCAVNIRRTFCWIHFTLLVVRCWLVVRSVAEFGNSFHLFHLIIITY